MTLGFCIQRINLPGLVTVFPLEIPSGNTGGLNLVYIFSVNWE